MKKNVYAVSGMKCVHCKVNVENALKASYFSTFVSHLLSSSCKNSF